MSKPFNIIYTGCKMLYMQICTSIIEISKQLYKRIINIINTKGLVLASSASAALCRVASSLIMASVNTDSTMTNNCIVLQLSYDNKLTCNSTGTTAAIVIMFSWSDLLDLLTL